ncbi:MAG: cobalt-precorrin 5A hydrolase [Lachnospiraceae bacterium]|nr:cobalt-precorrin 5A hydrolase [Lachnospiraceae bacterium]
MRLAMISFTDNGSSLCARLTGLLTDRGWDCEGYGVKKYAGKYGLEEIDNPLSEWTGEMFERKDALVFIGASGIAVRAIAPWVRDKKRDPAVVVMDERGIFAISLLSGHLGGANELAGMLANLTGAIPVITTATDVNGRFAVDVFAKKNKLHISSMEYAKEVTADILDEKPVGLVCELPIAGKVPEELVQVSHTEPFEGECGIVISLNEERSPFLKTLHLIPRCVTVGVGCRRGTPAEALEESVLKALAANHLSIYSVEQVASIELKKDERAITELCGKFSLPLCTYTAQELKDVPGDFESSAFVEQVTGVDNVCGRSAVLGSANGRLIQKKRAGGGVTVAIAIRDRSVDFG